MEMDDREFGGEYDVSVDVASAKEPVGTVMDPEDLE
jgi:hypothetical protein